MPSASAPLSQLLSRFLGWWVSELGSLVPVSWRSDGLPARRLVVVAGSDGPRIFEERRRRSRELTQAQDLSGRETEADAVLSRVSTRSRRPPVVLRLPFAAAFARTVVLPASAAREASRILSLDLERATPFRRPDVLAAHQVLPGEPSKGCLAVRQFVIKRETVRQAQQVLTRNGLEPDRIECCGEDDRAALPMDFLDWDRLQTPPSRTPLRGILVISACLLTFAAAAIAVARLEHALADVERVTAEFRIKVAAVTNERQRSETAERRTAELIALKTAEPHRASLIDRLSALLPDSDYLTALRIDGSEIELSGYSASTAALVPLIERSRIFTGAALTAPAVVDTRNGKERFTLKATIVEAVRGTVSDSLQRGG